MDDAQLQKIFDKIQDSFDKMQINMNTMNHSSETTASAMDKIACAVDKIEQGIASGFSTVNTEHANIKNNYDTTKLLFKFVIFPLILILGGLVGIKLAFPTI
jgi:hypothetical protein